MAKIGASLLGNPDDEEQPLRNIVTSAGQGLEGFLPQDPASRAALMQIGLGLMQPVALGQSTGGHIAQAIGGGGETVSRGAKQDLEEQKSEDKLALAQRLMDIRQQTADAATTRAARTLGEMTAYQREQLKLSSGRESRQEARDAARESAADEKSLNEEAKAAYKGSRDLITGDDDPDKRFKTKSLPEIKDILRAERASKTPAQQPAVAQPPGAAKPPTVRQNGHTYYLQPDGSYK